MKRYLHINVLTVVFKIVPKKWDVPKRCLLAVQDSYEKVFAYIRADSSVQNSAKKMGRSKKVLISCPGQLKK